MPELRSAAVVLAAGSASRMGHPKQLLRFRGQPLVRHAASVALDAGFDRVFVVLGAHEPEIRGVLEDLASTILVNATWKRGIGTSIRRALEAAGPVADTVTLLLADQPFVTAADLRALVAQHRVPQAPVVAARYEGTVGVPALFDRRVFAELLALADGEGCKRVIRAHADEGVFLDMPAAALDIDTPADLERLVRSAAADRAGRRDGVDRQLVLDDRDEIAGQRQTTAGDLPPTLESARPSA